MERSVVLLRMAVVLPLLALCGLAVELLVMQRCASSSLVQLQDSPHPDLLPPTLPDQLGTPASCRNVPPPRGSSTPASCRN